MAGCKLPLYCTGGRAHAFVGGANDYHRSVYGSLRSAHKSTRGAYGWGVGCTRMKKGRIWIKGRCTWMKRKVHMDEKGGVHAWEGGAHASGAGGAHSSRGRTILKGACT
jgi:hypothetical protein